MLVSKVINKKEELRFSQDSISINRGGVSGLDTLLYVNYEITEESLKTAEPNSRIEKLHIVYTLKREHKEPICCSGSHFEYGRKWANKGNGRWTIEESFGFTFGQKEILLEVYDFLQANIPDYMAALLPKPKGQTSDSQP